MSAAAGQDSHPTNKPFGYTAIGVFLFFGATMASYAAITLAFPGTILDEAWVLNPVAHQQLASLGRRTAFPYVLLALALFIAGLGWFRRRRWGWLLAVAIISINLLGNLFNAFRGEWFKGGVGVVIAGVLLAYMTSGKIREYFRRAETR
ncbi:MAG TPA: hypothetical protein VFA68_14765 [Terriglobales bacterium]|nr:hypothetical protein [Terriglobales bacterium]